jgi:hypothetical protein
MKPKSSSDSDYKRLFSHPELVRDLLIGYAPGKWLKNVDFSTLTHVNGSYVSEEGRQRHDDVVWRVNIGGRWIWVYILLEFQSESDPLMALRIMEYVNQLAFQIAREHKKYEFPEGRIPPIVPIVLYNGLPKWRAATDVADCFIKPPEELEAFIPRLKYLLLDEHRLKRSQTEGVRNFAYAVFRMEANRGKDEVFAVIRELAEMLSTPELKSLRRAFNIWTKGLLLRREQNPKIVEEISEIKDIFEDFDMAEAVFESWTDIARKEGERKGERKGEAKLIVRLLTRRFGPLPKRAETRVSKAKAKKKKKWFDTALDASNLTDVLGTPDHA